MAKIQPVSTWFNGEEHQANIFNLSIGYDDLATRATLNYDLSEELPQPEPSFKIMYNILMPQLSMRDTKFNINQH